MDLDLRHRVRAGTFRVVVRSPAQAPACPRGAAEGGGPVRRGLAAGRHPRSGPVSGPAMGSAGGSIHASARAPNQPWSTAPGVTGGRGGNRRPGGPVEADAPGAPREPDGQRAPDGTGAPDERKSAGHSSAGGQQRPNRPLADQPWSNSSNAVSSIDTPGRSTRSYPSSSMIGGADRSGPEGRTTSECAPQP